jgi:hypothetical protein
MHHKMRPILIIIFSTLTIVVKGQSIKIDSCGLDNKSVLTNWEIEYFKQSIKTLKSIDLENKMLAFAHGNFGSNVISKKDYFEKWGREYYTRNIVVSNILIKLTEEEKLLSGGYEYIIISWSKILPAGKNRKKLIEKVLRYSKTNQQ